MSLMNMMDMRMLALNLFALIALSTCVSERQDCLGELARDGDETACWLVGESANKKSYYESIGDTVKADSAQRDVEGFTLLCLKYLIDVQDCRERSSAVPVPTL